MASLPTPGGSDVWGASLNAAIESLHLGPDTHANRPTTSLVTGTLYSCTDHNLIYRWSGSAWVTYATLGRSALLDPTTPDDHFTGSTLPAGWSIAGSYVSGDYTVHDSLLDVATGRAAGSYFYRAAPGTDFVATMKVDAFTTGAAMFGIIAVDNTGAGVGMGWYNSNPDAPLSGTLTGGAWDAGSTNSAAGPKGTLAGGGMTTWYRLRKVGTSYYGAISINGNTWSAETVKTSSATMTRVGFGAWFGTVAKFQVDYFDVA